MWFLLGMFVGWLWFGEPRVRNTGIILVNPHQEVLLEQNNILGVWGFPTNVNVQQNTTYLQSAVKYLEEKTSLCSDQNYTLVSEGCTYRNTIYFFGTLHTLNGVPGDDTFEWFPVLALPQKRTMLVQDWIDDGMPVSCGFRDEL